MQSLGIVTTRIVSTFAIVFSLNAKLALNDDLIHCRDVSYEYIKIIIGVCIYIDKQ